MKAKNFFERAATADTGAEYIFRAVFFLSVVALLFPNPTVQEVTNILLVTLAITALPISLMGAIWQNEGNRQLRATQLRDALGAPIGEMARGDYYNNLLPPSLPRLAATTFENSFFSAAILNHMLRTKRLAALAYIVLFVLLVVCRWTTTSWIMLITQTLFSADVVGHWFRMERFQFRVNRVKDALHQFFVQGGMTGENNGLAIALAAFADYECSKDEAAMPLDGAVFKKLNPRLTKEWDQLRADLKIP